MSGLGAAQLWYSDQYQDQSDVSLLIKAAVHFIKSEK